jgi:RsiW-degrading membrane proteinase PrsW (M82 family)
VDATTALCVVLGVAVGTYATVWPRTAVRRHLRAEAFGARNADRVEPAIWYVAGTRLFGLFALGVAGVVLAWSLGLV